MSSAPRALVFDCDGVLGETERFGHLPAFNQMFDEFGLPVEWTEDTYAEWTRIGGGKERLARLLTPEFVTRLGLPIEPEQQRRLINRWHRRKSEIYVELVTGGAVPPRPGVGRVVEEALQAGWQLAVASTSAEPSVRSVLERAVGAERAARFHVFAGDVVPEKKPAPDIYRLAFEELGVTGDEAVVVEDSAVGLRAARAAGACCVVVTVSSYTGDDDFSGAALVVSDLGDERTRPTVLAAPAGMQPDGQVVLRDLIACWRASCPG